MRKSRFTEDQISAILAEQERGMSTAEVCRRPGVSSATFYKWKARYGGLDVSDARRLKTLESENARLRKLLAEAMLDNAVLKDLLGKPRRRRTSGGMLRFGRWPVTASLSAVPAAWPASIRRRCVASACPTIRRSVRGCGRSPPSGVVLAVGGSD